MRTVNNVPVTSIRQYAFFVYSSGMHHQTKLYLWAFVGLFSATVLYVQAQFGATNTVVLGIFSPSSVTASVAGAFGPEFDPTTYDHTALKAEGFHIADIRYGKGKEVTARTEVTLHYKLETSNGVAVRDTRAAGDEPYTFTIGSGDTVKGMSIGLLGMREGGERTLVIPPQYAYGDVPTTGIPQGEAMVFTVALLSVK